MNPYDWGSYMKRQKPQTFPKPFAVSRVFTAFPQKPEQHKRQQQGKDKAVQFIQPGLVLLSVSHADAFAGAWNNLWLRLFA